ncbi:MAG: ADOP family duplicated permease [Acidobacteriota bacterium]
MPSYPLPPALRSLVRRPRFTAPAVLTLAAGLGAATAIFALVDTALLRPLPFPDSERVVGFWGQGSWTRAELDFIRDHAESYSAVGAVATGDVLYGDERPTVVEVGIVSPDALQSLAVQPPIGRLFEADEETKGQDRVVLVSDGFWRRELGADRAALGRSLTIDQERYEIVGIMPPDFAFPTRDTELWLPLTIDRDAGAYRGAHFLALIGRLAPEASIASANQELDRLVPVLTETFNLEPGFDKLSTPATVVKLRHQLTGPARAPLYLLLGASGLLLLVSCVNVAHLLLAQAAAREKEMAIRGALGAGRSTLITQLLLEATAIAVAGGGLALLLAAWAIAGLRAALPAATPRLEALAIDGRVFAVGGALSLATVIFFGLVPALYGSRLDLRHAMAERHPGGGRNRQRTGKALVVAEMALASLLAVLAVSSARSFIALDRLSPGFEPQNLLTLRPELDGGAWADRQRLVDFYAQATEALEGVPGITAAGGISRLPVAEFGGYQSLEIEGREATSGRVDSAYWRATVGDYFTAMQIPILRGRAFHAGDLAGSTPVGVISESMARAFWPAGDALDRRFRSSADGDQWVTVVGIAADVRHEGIQTPVQSTIYRPFSQSPHWVTRLALVARTANAEAPMDPLRDAVVGLGSGVAVHRMARFTDLMADSIARERLTSSVVSAYGTLAVLLASIGVFGLLSFSVGERRRELGIRMALGAQRRSILQRVLAEGLAPAAVGIAAGLGLAAVASRLLGGWLYTAGQQDPVSSATVAAALLAVAAFACWWPAERAAAVEPVQVLREN